MALLDINWNPEKKQLRVFLLLLVGFVGALGTVVYLRTGWQVLPIAIVVAAVVIAAAGWFVPQLSRMLYVVWMAVAFPISWTISHAVMAVVYYCVVTPIGLCLRILGRDPLKRKFDPDAKSYWREHQPTDDVSRYFRQF